MAPSSSTELPSPTDYRAFADECLRWANQAPSQAQRNTLIEIARVWMQTALDREMPEPNTPNTQWAASVGELVWRSIEGKPVTIKA
jgi:hypothetical protein